MLSYFNKIIWHYLANQSILLTTKMLKPNQARKCRKLLYGPFGFAHKLLNLLDRNFWSHKFYRRFSIGFHLPIDLLHGWNNPIDAYSNDRNCIQSILIYLNLTQQIFYVNEPTHCALSFLCFKIYYPNLHYSTFNLFIYFVKNSDTW